MARESMPFCRDFKSGSGHISNLFAKFKSCPSWGSDRSALLLGDWPGLLFLSASLLGVWLRGLGELNLLVDYVVAVVVDLVTFIVL